MGELNMKINYGVNRVIRGKGVKTVEHMNGKLLTAHNANTQTVFARIRAKHPGWIVTGYCPTSKKS